MNIFIKTIVFYTVILMFLLFYSSVVQAKKRCKPFLEKLHKVQTQQRNGYSLKRGQSLRAKEDKARDKWWQCEHMSRAKFKAEYVGGNKKKKKVKKRKNKNSSKSAYKKASNRKALLYDSKRITTFNQGSAIVVKAKYQGDKRLAWSQFYQRPSKCISPKSLSVFAYCNENKLQQQNQFDQGYIK
jgi:hypothetical protein